MGNYIELDGKTLYIKIEDANPEFITQLASKILEINPSSTVLDVRGLSCSLKEIELLTETIKFTGKSISLFDNSTSPKIKEMLGSLGTTLNYDEIEFATEEDKNNFEIYTVDGVNKYINESVERLTLPSEEQFLNSAAKAHLKNIISDYKDVLTDEQKAKLNALLDTDMVVVEQDHTKYATFKESHGEKEEPKDFPPAHGGKVYGDGKVHLYLNKFNQGDIESMLGVLIHELFHYVISPEYSEKHPEVNSFLAEGLVDMSALDYMNKRFIQGSYQSNYSRNVIFAREKLNTLPDEETKKALCVRCSVDQFIAATSKTEESFLRDFEEAKNHQTRYEKMIDDIVDLFPTNKESSKRYLMGKAAVSTPKEALTNYIEASKELDISDSLGMTKEQYEEMIRKMEQIVASYNASKEASL